MSNQSGNRVVTVYRALDGVESRIWWGPVLRGVVAVALGLVMVLFERPFADTAMILFGAFALVNGVVQIVCAALDRSAGARRGTVVALGAVSIVLGLVMVIWRSQVLDWAVVALGAFVVVMGVVGLVAAIRAKAATGPNLVWPLVLIVLGVAMAALSPFMTDVLVVLLGLALVVLGIALVAIGVSIRKALKNTTVVAAG